MSSPATPPKTLSAFTPLRGGYTVAVPPGSRLVTLGSGATWWEGDSPVTVELPNIPVGGSRWTPDGRSLRVGLGAIDLAARVWRAEPALKSWNEPWPDGDRPVQAVAWFANNTHVAMLLESRDRDGKRTREIVVASAADGLPRGRYAVAQYGTVTLSASEDRLLVAAQKAIVIDLDANVVAEPAPMPDSVIRANYGEGMFAAVGAAGQVALVRAESGAVIATWDMHANDAVPIPRGVVSIDLEGNVRVGCLEGTAVRTVAEVASGAFGAIIQLVGGRIVVAGATGVRVATWNGSCR